MMYATKIKMCSGCEKAMNCEDIESIYIEGSKDEGFYIKKNLYNHLINNPKIIKVKLGSYPYLLPALSPNGTKYVRSEPNDTVNDNLLELPRV